MVTHSGSTSFAATRARLWSWERLGLVGVLLLAAVLYSARLSQNGYANEYYAAAVRSMLQSWHNFFFASFDPGGFVTVDKPPLALWVQAISAKIFGFNTWALLLPQALAGVASIALVYQMVRRVWGYPTALLAALIMTLTPITVAINRDNNPDTLLALTLVLAAWATIRAIETSKLRFVVLCAVMIGLGFNTKMLQALIVVPALGLAYLVGTQVAWRQRVLHLVVAGAVLIAVGGAWTVAVDLTPADQRPYVGGSSNNTMRDLIFGYNGLGRIFGNGNNPGGNRANPPANAANPFGGDGSNPIPGTVPGAGTGLRPDGRGAFPNDGPGGPGGSAFGGEPGMFRLFTTEIGSQMVWLFPLALGGAVVALRRRPRFPLSRKATNIVLWSAWLLIHLVVFSFAQGIFHPYYLTVVTPAWAVLIAVGTTTLWRAFRAGGWRAACLPIALIATAAWQAYLLWPSAQNSNSLQVLIFSLIVIATVGAVVGAAELGWIWWRGRQRLGRRVLNGALLALLISPGVWSITPLLSPINGSIPQAGFITNIGMGNPAQVGGGMQFGGAPNGTTTMPPQIGAARTNTNSALVSFLQANQGDTTYLLAVQSSQSASSIIIETGEPVMAMGGFSGGDAILTTESFSQLVATKTVRYVQTGNGRMPGATGQNTVSQWITQNCAVVDPSLWGGGTQSSTPTTDGMTPQTAAGRNFGGPGSGQLYDCARAN